MDHLAECLHYKHRPECGPQNTFCKPETETGESLGLTGKPTWPRPVRDPVSKNVKDWDRRTEER